jgi:hypothetical protein
MPVDFLALHQERPELLRNATDLLGDLHTCQALLREASMSLVRVRNELGTLKMEVSLHGCDRLPDDLLSSLDDKQNAIEQSMSFFHLIFGI